MLRMAWEISERDSERKWSRCDGWPPQGNYICCCYTMWSDEKGCGRRGQLLKCTRALHSHLDVIALFSWIDHRMPIDGNRFGKHKISTSNWDNWKLKFLAEFCRRRTRNIEIRVVSNIRIKWAYLRDWQIYFPLTTPSYYTPDSHHSENH